MQACRDRCRSAILGCMVIGALRIGWGGASSKNADNHVGENGAHLGDVEGREGRVHHGLPEILAPAQEFRVDRTDFVECLAQPVEVAYQTGDALVRGVRNVISARPPSGLTDDQIPLRTMSWPAGTVAVRPTASLVGLGQGTA